MWTSWTTATRTSRDRTQSQATRNATGLMGAIADALEPLTRKIPALVGGALLQGEVKIEPIGSIAEDPAPGEIVWEIGSITKVFTGLLLAEMSLRGELSLDDPIGTYVPEDAQARLPDPARQPTLTDLSCHRSGLPRLPKAWLVRFRKDPDPYAQISEQDVWDALGPKTQRPAKPKVRYSNYGAGLLGLLLASAAGMPFERLVAERILEPLGMRSTGFDMEPLPGFRKGKPTTPWTFQSLAAAGGLRSTVNDMLRFAAAVIEPPEHLAAALALSQQPVQLGRVAGPPLGWQTRKHPNRENDLWHNGGTYGGASFLAIDRAAGKAVATFANTGPRFVPQLDGRSWKLFDSLG